MHRVGDALTGRKGVGVFGSALLRCEGVRGFGFGIGCSGVVQMTRDGCRQVGIGCIGVVLRLVLLAGWNGEQRGFGGRRDLDCGAPRVRWLRTPLRGKAKAQGTRPSKPEKKGMRPIGNSRGIAVQVGRLLSGSGKALDTFLCPLHESSLVEGKRM